MAHYAYLDENNIVTFVCVGKNEGEDGIDWEQYYGAKRTSFNTCGGIYYNSATNEPDSDQSKAFRKNFASIGYTYDPEKDAFIPPKPFESWILDEYSCLWNAPVPYPQDGSLYRWDENTTSWTLI